TSNQQPASTQQRTALRANDPTPTHSTRTDNPDHDHGPCAAVSRRGARPGREGDDRAGAYDRSGEWSCRTHYAARLVSADKPDGLLSGAVRGSAGRFHSRFDTDAPDRLDIRLQRDGDDPTRGRGSG